MNHHKQYARSKHRLYFSPLLKVFLYFDENAVPVYRVLAAPITPGYTAGVTSMTSVPFILRQHLSFYYYSTLQAKNPPKFCRIFSNNLVDYMQNRNILSFGSELIQPAPNQT